MRGPAPTVDDSHAVQCDLASEVLRTSGTLRLKVRGWSMLPSIWPGDTLVVENVKNDAVSKGDLVLFSCGRRFVAHRVVATIDDRDWKVQTQGDAVPVPDAPVCGSDLLGRVSLIVRDGRVIEPSRNLGFSTRALATVFRRSQIAARVVVGIHGMRQSSSTLNSQGRTSQGQTLQSQN